MKILILFVSVFFLQISNASEAKKYQFSELLSLIKKHPDLDKAQVEIEKARLLFKKIQGETGPKFSAIVGIAPNESVSGNPTQSRSSDKLDTTTRLLNLEIKYPLFMYNRSGNLKEANEYNVQIKELEHKKKELELIKNLKEYYYGFKYASSLKSFAEDTIKDLDEAVNGIKAGKENDESSLKLKIFRSMAKAKLYEVNKGLELAKLGLRYITQDFSSADITIDEDWIEFRSGEKLDLKTLKAEVLTSNIDYQRAVFGEKAKKLYSLSESKALYPVFGLFSKYEYRKTPGSEKQTSDFAYDPYNQSDFSLGVGFVWDFEFGSRQSQKLEAAIEAEQMKREKLFAENNLPLMFDKLNAEYEEAFLKAEVYHQAYKDSKKLMNKVGSGVALGLTPAKEIIESYSLKAEAYKNYLEAVYHFELKDAEVRYFLGRE